LGNSPPEAEAFLNVQDTTLFVIGSYINDIDATYLFTEFGAIEVQTTEQL